MKKICCFVAIAVCLGLASAAHAVQVNFSANILDPSPPDGMELYSNTFSATFSSCSAYTGVPSGLTGDYCFEGINATNFDKDDCNSNDVCKHDSDDPAGSIWTSLTITLNDPDHLLATASCGTITTGALFNSSNCTETGDVYTLAFTGGTGIGIDDPFFIVIAGPTLNTDQLDSLSTSDVAGIGTPEPNSALLLATGTGMFGLLLYAERRRLPRESTNR